MKTSASTPGGPRRVTVRASTLEALRARTAQKTEELKRAPGSERVLVVYAPHGASLYVEGVPARSRQEVRS